MRWLQRGVVAKRAMVHASRPTGYIHQESVVRNLWYGMKIAHDAGGAMALGYVPDCFGQGGNMPQIYTQFGIHHALFWH